LASGEGTREIVIGLVMSIVGIGSILFDAPFICIGFAIFGPILFLSGLYKAFRAPSRPAMYYPPPYPPGPYYPPQGAPPNPAPPAAAPQAGSRRCATCGAESRADARFCTSCGTPF